MNLRSLWIRLRSNSLVRDSLWSLSGNAIGRGLSLLAAIFIARFLGKDIFGEYSLIKTTILTIGIFSSFGMGYTATKFVADFKRDAPEYIHLFISYATKITIIFSGILAVILFTFAGYVAENIFEAVSLTNPLRYLAVLIVFNAITSTQVGILSGLGIFKVLAKINAAIGVITFLLSVFLTYFWDFQGALTALLGAQISNCILNYIIVRKNVPQTKQINIPYTGLQKEIIKFTTPIALQEAVYSLTSWIGSILLVRYANFGELGMYNAAMQWNAIILFIPGIMRNVILSHLSSNSQKQEQHKRILKQTIQINLFATLIPCFIVMILSPSIADLYGDSFDELPSLMILAVFVTIFKSVNNVYSQAYTSIGKNWEMFIMRMLRDFGALIVFILIINNLNISGMYSMVISKLLLSTIFLIIIRWYYNKIYIAKNQIYNI